MKLRLCISDMLILEVSILWLNFLNVFVSKEGIVSLPNLVLWLYLKVHLLRYENVIFGKPTTFGGTQTTAYL